MNDNKNGMTVIVKTISSVVIIFIFVFAFYIILNGHLTPGGGFAGGSILACGLTLLMLAFGKDIVLKRLSHHKLNIYDCIGALAFVLLGLAGLLFGESFLLNIIGKGSKFDLYSSGSIFWLNLAVGIKVGASLFAVLLALSAFRVLGDKEKQK